MGQKRPVALARAMAMQPADIEADEPTNDLDVATADAVMRVLAEYAEQGNAVVCATHDMNLAARAGRVLHLEDGTLGVADASD